MPERDGTGEFELIRRHFAPLAAGAPLAFGLTDDAAVVRPTSGTDLVITTDCLVAGVHFHSHDPPLRIARKLLRVNLSDLAAMGALPVGYTLAAAFRNDTTDAWIAEFAAGLALDQERYAIALLGGDTVASSGPLTFTVTALGEVPEGRALRRSGAKPGDLVYVSGTIGDAMLGLLLRKGALVGIPGLASQSLIDRHQLPEPRLALGRALRGTASAVIDVSDGLVADLGHICTASGVAAELQAAAVPLSAAAREIVTAAPLRLIEMITGGDDYELCLTVPPAREAALRQAADAAEVPVCRIGRIKEGAGVAVLAPDGTTMRLQRTGYRHF